MPFFHDANEEIRDLNRSEKNVIMLTLFGGFFASFDFIIYFFFNDVINQAFFPASMPDSMKSLCYLLFILIGYISRPLGGIFLGDFGDRKGRKPVLLFSLILISISTLLIGLLPTYHQIGIWAIILMLILRLCQGFGYGAEVPASWVFLAEFMPRRHLGSVCGGLVSALVLSSLLGNVLSSVLSSTLTPAQMSLFGWRIPFIIGSIGTFLAIFLRSRLSETPLWLHAQANNKLVKKFPLQRIVRKYRYGLIMTLGLSWFISSIYLVIFLMIPILGVRFFDIDSNLMAITNGLGILFGCIGCIVYGYFADRFNPGRVFTVGCIILGLMSVIFFIALKNNSELLLLYYAVLGFCAGVIGIVPSACVRLFPANIRLSGVSASYNIIYSIIGSITPFFLIYFSKQLDLSAALYLVFVCVVGVIMGILLTNLHGLYRIEDHRLVKI